MNATKEAANETARFLHEEQTGEAVPNEVKKTKGSKTKWIVTIVLFLVLAFGIGFTVFLLYHSNSWFKKKFIYYAKYTKEAIFWNGLIRFYLQSFLKNCMSIFTFYFFIDKK